MVNIVLAVVALLIAIAYGFGIAAIPTLLISDVLGPTAYPKVLLVLLLGVSGLLLAEGLRQKNYAASIAEFRRFLKEESFAFAGSALAILAFFLLFEPLGYLLSTLIFLLFSMLVLYRGPRWIPVITAVGFCAVSYLIFVDAFGTQLPRGVLPF